MTQGQGFSTHSIPGFCERLHDALSSAVGPGHGMAERAAERLGASNAAVRNWVAGRAYPSTPYLHAIVRMTQRSADWLLFGEAGELSAATGGVARAAAERKNVVPASCAVNAP